MRLNLGKKLYLHSFRPNAVGRPRLIEQFNEGLYRKLTLISAPAGFGKTTLASQWGEGIKQPTAWVSLDAGENDPTPFLPTLVAPLQTIVPTSGEATLSPPQSPQPPSLHALSPPPPNHPAPTRT